MASLAQKYVSLERGSHTNTAFLRKNGHYLSIENKYMVDKLHMDIWLVVFHPFKQN
jgi:hypothetical protein